MVESTRLESEHTGNRIVGSNPTLSAIPTSQAAHQTLEALRIFDICNTHAETARRVA